MLVWTFHFPQPARWPAAATKQVMRGVSATCSFDAAGKVNYHRDYWDAAEELYMKLPGHWHA
jgi:steroid delta-isomerase